MSYNTDLQTNNTSLQEILATVNSLPEAGGSSGGGLEWIDVLSLPTTYYTPPSSNANLLTYYLPITNNTVSVIVSYVDSYGSNNAMAIIQKKNSVWEKDYGSISSNEYLEFIQDDTDYYIMIKLLSTTLQAKALIIDLPSN